jgi:hypothetical protein
MRREAVRRPFFRPPTLAVAALVLFPAASWANGGVTFEDVAAGDGAGISYRRVPSENNAIFDAIKNDPPYTPEKREATPIKARGAPGVAIFDYDNDGDLDLYATNGPGAANSLYSNQLEETGEVTFVDVAAAAGVGAEDQDSTGVCFGDIDNDGDHDLLVVSHNAPDRLFENDGDGTFTDITASSGIAASGVHVSSGCSMGDVDNDGLLDISIANTYDNWSHFRGVLVVPYALNQHNQLLLNAGGNTFVDVSETSGIRDLAGFAPEGAGAAGLTWAIAMADVDLDGDIDILNADDQGGIPPPATGGVDRGILHVLVNDGTGSFTDRAVEMGTDKWGSWMGLTFGDFNCDRRMDFFATNFGDYAPVGEQVAGEETSRWFLGQEDGTFADPNVGDLVTDPFGWGASAVDYDNDGDLDVIYHGNHDVGPGIEASNPGVILANPFCTAEFERDAVALAGSTDHNRRTVHGMAVGDLDRNGFDDVVSVSNLDIPVSIPLLPHAPLGSPFDQDTAFLYNFEPDPVTGELVWNGNVYDDGTLSVELSSGGNGNNSLSVRTVGTVGITRKGRVNRDGIGAVVSFRPLGGRWTMRPVVGGSSYASQDALELTFGMGAAERAVVEVLWPGGVRNRLYYVRAGSRLTFPEIPCSYDDDSWNLHEYLYCVTTALDELVDAGVLSRGERVSYLLSALRARRDTLGPACALGRELDDVEAFEFYDGDF